MNKKTFLSSSLWLSFLELIKKLFILFKKGFNQLGFSQLQEKNLKLFENIQLTFIYFFAIIDLVYSLLREALATEYFSDLFDSFFFIIQYILQQPFLQIFSSPEKLFFLSYVVIELMVVKSIFQFSLLIRYNILLVFGLLMLQGLTISYWDFFFHQELVEPFRDISLDEEIDNNFFFNDDFLAIFFFLSIFFIYFGFYIFFYINALRGKFATFSGIHWLTDSISFWLKIKTSTMPFGKRKKK
jgi:hypothetical protein